MPSGSQVSRMSRKSGPARSSPTCSVNASTFDACRSLLRFRIRHARRVVKERPCPGRSPGLRLQRALCTFPGFFRHPSGFRQMTLAAHSCGGSHGFAGGNTYRCAPCSLLAGSRKRPRPGTWTGRIKGHANGPVNDRLQPEAKFPASMWLRSALGTNNRHARVPGAPVPVTSDHSMLRAPDVRLELCRQARRYMQA